MGTRKTTFGTRTKLAAFMADLGSEVRLNLNNHNSFSFSFVLNKELQLMETPVANPIIHSPSSADFSNPPEVFHYNLVAVEIGNNASTDVMINPSHKPFLFARNLLEKTSGTFSAFGLKNRTQIFELPFDLLDFGGIIKPAVRSDSKVIYSAVNAKNLIMEVKAFSINHFGKREQEEASVSLVNSQQTFLDIPIEILLVAVGNVKWNLDSSLDCRQTQNVVFEGTRAWEVVSDRASVYHWLGFGFLYHPAGLLNASNRKLRRQGFSEVLVDERMQSDIIFNSFYPSSIDAELQSFAVNFDCLDYLDRCLDFDFCCGSNFHKKMKAEQIYKRYRRECPVEVAFLP